MSGFIIPEPYRSQLLQAVQEGQAEIKGPDIMLKIRDSIRAWNKLLAELKEVNDG